MGLLGLPADGHGDDDGSQPEYSTSLVAAPLAASPRRGAGHEEDTHQWVDVLPDS